MLNSGWLSGTVETAPTVREWKGGNTIQFTLRAVTDRWRAKDGTAKEREADIEFCVDAKDGYEPPTYGEVAALVVGQAIVVEYRLAQVQYMKHGEDKRFTKFVVERIKSLGAAPQQQAIAPDEGLESDVPF